LQHLAFCPRQCALIHVERVWDENVLTAEGRVLHERVDSGEVTTESDVRVVRGVSIRSLRLGLAGRVDVLELRCGEDGRLVPFPVEYKRGRAKKGDWDEVQLCAQALCIEEMMGVPVPRGALFYASPRRRIEIVLNERLRCRVEELALALHALVESGETPPAEFSEKCRRCSLENHCMPSLSARSGGVWKWTLDIAKEPKGR